MGIFKRMRKRRQDRKDDAPILIDPKGRPITVGEKPKRRRIFGGGFFSKERVKARRDFRISVSGNRKWIMIGVAVVAVCGTIIYLSVTYGGGGLLKLINL